MRRYLRYMLRNIEPLRIADDSTSQEGQTMTLRYIPGTTIRGLVVNALARAADFEQIKHSLFSTDVRFLNAYPARAGRELFPSPKGFYEDKSVTQGKKAIENVVIRGEFTEGMKRASLGGYSYFQEDTVYYYGVDTGSNLKITIGTPEKKQNVFRSEYIAPGSLFAGYIAVENPALEERIRKVLEGTVVLGNARSAGMGKCEVLRAEYTEQIPYEELLPGADAKGCCDMMLLSNTVMRNSDGELYGINWKKLEEMMGINELHVEYCATSTFCVKGYNRTLGIHIPSAVMYAQGSVFRLKYAGIFTAEKMRRIADMGIGIRRNEGFGRVIFLKDYENILYKQAGKERPPEEEKALLITGAAASAGISETAENAKKPEDDKVLMQIAKNYYKNLLRRKMQDYIVENPIPRGSIKNSQLGKLEAFTAAYQYNPLEGKKAVEKYLGHAREKEERRKTQKERGSIKEFSRFVGEVFDTDLDELLSMEKKETIMGIEKKELLSSEEVYRMKMLFLTELIRYDNKKGAR